MHLGVSDNVHNNQYFPLAFPDVRNDLFLRQYLSAFPDDVRNDLYVTIMQSELKRTGRATDRNIEVTLCVCNQNGDVLQVHFLYKIYVFKEDYRKDNSYVRLWNNLFA